MEENNNKYSIIEIDDAKYETLLTRNYLNRKPYKPKNPKHISSFIPGIIKKIHVKLGDVVKVGDKLLELEAMKMNNLVVANIAGKIHKIHVKQNEQIPKNHLLIEIK